MFQASSGSSGKSDVLGLYLHLLRCEDITSLPCTCSESCWTRTCGPTRNLFLKGTTNALCKEGDKEWQHAHYICLLLTHAPSFLWTLLTKHKFKDKILRISAWWQESIKPMLGALLSTGPVWLHRSHAHKARPKYCYFCNPYDWILKTFPWLSILGYESSLSGISRGPEFCPAWIPGFLDNDK